ncbi:MAG: hypothetical protein ACHP7B_03775 [Burkholderiales bacterium]
MHAAGIESALTLVDASQLLLGTDAPLRRSVDQLAELHARGLAGDVLRAIECDNARRLLDRFRDVSS